MAGLLRERDSNVTLTRVEAGSYDVKLSAQALRRQRRARGGVRARQQQDAGQWWPPPP